MKYAEQAQTALNRLDIALGQLRTIVKNGQTNEALQYMEKGDLKERFEELQNIITISQTGTLGARGVQNTGTL